MIAATASPDLAEGRPVDQGPIATVNGAVVSATDFEQTYIGFLIATGRNDTPANRYLHLDNLVDTYLLAEEAGRRGLDREPAFAHFAERTLQKAVGSRFYEQSFLETLAPLTDEEIRAAYVLSTQQVVVRHLFYRDAAAAQAAYGRLLAGRAFLEEAQDCYELAVFDSLAGFLGPVGYFQVDDAFAEAAFALEVGTFSEPVRSRYGFHIIRAEDRIVQPILTESQFQTRKQGLASQLRQRRMRLEGDRWVRAFMEARDVRIRPEGIQALEAALRDLEHRVAPEAVVVEAQGDTPAPDRDALRAALTPETVLASFELDGETRTFTAGDFYFWLEDLPFEEARHRTAASVGRAMRNEVLALAGRARGVEAQASVQEVVARQRRIYLADAFRQDLRNAPHPPPEDDLLRQAYERLGLDQQKVWTASFWTATFEARAAALEAREALAAGTQAPHDLAGFAAFEEHPLAESPALKRHVVTAPLGETLVVGLGDGAWLLLHVAEREATAPSLEMVRDRLAQRVGPFVNEYALLRRLRAEAEVHVDTLAFERMMMLSE